MGNDTDKKEEEKFSKPIVANLVVGADRSCTNLFWLVLFIAVWVGFIAFSGVAFANGDLAKLIYGYDYLGNVCGQGTPKNVTAAAVASWSTKKFLFYPIGFNSKTGGFNVKDARNLGICVDKCPAAGAVIQTYSAGGAGLNTVPGSYLSLFSSSPKFNRCVPSFLDFNCTNATKNDPAAANSCLQSTKDSSSLFDTLSGMGDVAANGFRDVKERWWVILVCAIISIVLSFVMLFVLNRAVKPVVTITILLVLVAVGLIAGFCLMEYQRIKKLPHGDENMMKTYMAVGISAAIFELILLCVLLWLRSDIMIACDIIEEAAQIPTSIKTMLTVPPILAPILLGILIFFLFVAANIYTASSMISMSVPRLSSDGNATNSTGLRISVQRADFPNWRGWGFAFCIFQFLWTYAFLTAICFMVLALCSAHWYFCSTSYPKQPQHGVLKGFAIVLRYHLGTAALGALIIAIIQCIRIALAWAENQMRKLAQRDGTGAIRVVICCCQCCVSCMESIVKFISKNGYITTMITGEPFITACRHALSLLMSNVASVAAVTIITEYVLFFSKIIITAASVGVGYLILSGFDDFSAAGLIMMLIMIGCAAYFIASVFMSVFGVAIDTMLICYCYDMEQHDGSVQRPYFMPPDLAQHLDVARARMQKAADDKKQLEATDAYKKVES